MDTWPTPSGHLPTNSTRQIGPWNSTNDAHAPEKVYWALLMIPLPLVAVVGNILVILSVYKEKTLQSATNYFIVSLAFADLLVAAVVMPFAVYVLVNVDWDLSETLCDFYIALDVTCSTASIFNLVAISIDRFIAVTQPIKYSKHKNNKRLFLTIAVLWLVSAAIGSPIVLGLNTSPERIPNLCVFYNSDFIIYSSLSSFYIPCIVMVYLYYKIFSAIHERAKKAIGQKTPLVPAKDGTGQEGLSSAGRHHTKEKSVTCVLKTDKEKLVTKLSTLHELEEANHFPNTDIEIDLSEHSTRKVVEISGDLKSLARDNDDLKSLVRESGDSEKTLRINSDAPEALTNDYRAQPEMPLNSNGEAIKRLCPGSSDPKNPTDYEATGEKAEEDAEGLKPKKRSKFCLVKQRKNSKKREKNAARRERKATKTLAIVLGVFLVCWVPFFTCNILDAICIKLQSDRCRPGVTAFLLTTWLGYVNSCVNPVIYTIFNMEFRKAFKKLLLRPCK